MRVKTTICAAVMFGLALPVAGIATADDQKPAAEATEKTDKVELSQADIPKRKPGHWRITTVAANLGKTTIDTCIGPDDSIAMPADNGDCGEPKVEKAGTETIVTIVCKRPYAKQTMSTVFGGDFNKRYRAIMKMTFDPPDGFQTMGVTLDGEYIGPDCPPETKQDKKDEKK